MEKNIVLSQKWAIITCIYPENKLPATIDVSVFYGKRNEKGWKRLKKDGIKALVVYATKQRRYMSTRRSQPLTAASQRTYIATKLAFVVTKTTFVVTKRAFVVAKHNTSSNNGHVRHV